MNMAVSADTLSVTCCGWTANDQMCTFEVRTLTQDCGFTGDAATSSVTLSGEYCIGYIILYSTSQMFRCIVGIDLGVCICVSLYNKPGLRRDARIMTFKFNLGELGSE